MAAPVGANSGSQIEGSILGVRRKGGEIWGEGSFEVGIYWAWVSVRKESGKW